MDKDARNKLYVLMDMFFKNPKSINIALTRGPAYQITKEICAGDTSSDLLPWGTPSDITVAHSLSVAISSAAIGKEMGLEFDKINDLFTAGLFHDIGKAYTPERILNKPGKLTDAEFSVIKSHPLDGYNLLLGKTDSLDILRGVLEHHEKLSGGGYPFGKTGENISNFAKIIAVADIYNALVSWRPYKKPLEKSVALKKMSEMKGDLDDKSFKTLSSIVKREADKDNEKPQALCPSFS